MGGNGRDKRKGAWAGACLLLMGLLPLAVSGLGAFWLVWPDRVAGLKAALAPAPSFKADRAVVYKGRRELLLYRDGRMLKRYPVALGFDPVGPKRRQGDGRTPEGAYVLDWRHISKDLGPAIHISYPNAGDRARAAAAGVDPGGAIMLHALPDTLPWDARPVQARAWTEGCIGLKARHLREVWSAVADGTPIDIRP